MAPPLTTTRSQATGLVLSAASTTSQTAPNASSAALKAPAAAAAAAVAVARPLPAGALTPARGTTATGAPTPVPAIGPALTAGPTTSRETRRASSAARRAAEAEAEARCKSRLSETITRSQAIGPALTAGQTTSRETRRVTSAVRRAAEAEARCKSPLSETITRIQEDSRGGRVLEEVADPAATSAARWSSCSSLPRGVRTAMVGLVTAANTLLGARTVPSASCSAARPSVTATGACAHSASLTSAETTV